MKAFNTLAEFKRILQKGDKLNCIRHSFNPCEYPEREVTIKQTNSFALKTVQPNGEIIDSWCEFPKASETKIENNKLIILDEKGEPWLTYWFA